MRDHNERLIRGAVVRMRRRILAITFALSCGTGLAVATLWLVIRGGPNVGQHLGLLRHYFPGYTVTWHGTLLGFFYGALVGGMIGWTLAWLYNLVAERRNQSPL